MGAVRALLASLGALLALLLLGACDPALEALHARALSGQALLLLAPPTLPLAPCPSTLTLIALGYALAPDGSASAALRERVEAAAAAYHACAAQGSAVRLVFSGGVPAGRAASEAAVMQALALRHLNYTAAPPEWLLEAASTSTLENALLSLALLPPAARQGVIAVATSPFHQLRSYWTFRCALGGAPALTVLPVPRAPPATSAQRAARAAEAAREALALVYYLARGRLYC
jgi:uncharacterized SAM-binding protein YcdF (DUF218 family)